MGASFSSPLVTTAWLAAHLGDPSLRIVDCSMVRKDIEGGGYAFVNGRDQWLQAHIPGSIHVDVPSQLSDATAPLPMTMPPVAELMQRFAALGLGDGTRIVLYDTSNHGWAARVWWLLRVCGVDEAAVLDGGWIKWTREGRPVNSDVTQFPASTLSTQPRPHLMADKQRVMESLTLKDSVRVYALSPAIYNGAVQIFPRKGRIPRSCNVHCDALLDPATNAYRSKEALVDLFAQAGALDKSDVITYCGGGIAACSDALALMAIGHPNVAVYDGSMQEWVSDPACPMEQ